MQATDDLSVLPYMVRIRVNKRLCGVFNSFLDIVAEIDSNTISPFLPFHSTKLCHSDTLADLNYHIIKP